MYFIILGVIIILMHFLGFGPPAGWTWNLTGDLWKFCLPFALAAVWWAFADSTGYTKRREMEKMDERKRQRRDQNLEALGMDKTARRAKKAARR
ncbi:TIGR04438 family Trp-rich protein [Variovorax sp. YR752]|uniref:TIGR04438 family Trp-rich protein n=1 Tax=Variovorax sp. YR752 TaxID=1884383 RepID=UPI003137B7B2